MNLLLPACRNYFFALLALMLFACDGSVSSGNNNIEFDADGNVLLEENISLVGSITASASSVNTITYSITGGADSSLFTIDSNSASLAFISAPDFETPVDSDANNVYQVEVSASDGVNTVNQQITITVSNTNDNSPVFNTGENVAIAENGLSVATITAADEDNDTLSYSLSGGTDQSQFVIDSASGVLMFNASPDYEAPTDSDSNNTYQVQVSVSDGLNTVDQLMNVVVSNVNDNSPSIGTNANIAIQENTQDVVAVVATDPDNDSLSFSLSGGTDQSQFAIDSASGALVFNASPDYEAPTDSDSNNTYQVEVTVSDSANSTSQIITVSVTDLNEALYGLDTRPSNPTCLISAAPVTSTDIQLTRVFNNLTFTDPVALRQSPVLQDRWYVVEKPGTIRTFLTNDTASSVFLDISSLVYSNDLEMGLLGFAFHPDYATNKYVYVNYTSVDPRRTTISRFTAINDTQLDAASEQVILVISQPDTNHNGGNILFGPDGYLYIGMGDGGGAGDQGNNAQDVNSLLGKILRIDVDNPANGNQYSSPSTNPYVGVSGRDEIYALGLRNPWRWSFDRVTGDLIAADVGQSNWEEIDVIVNGGNYGWRCYEGNHAYNTGGCLAQSAYTAPVHEYDHGTGFSITGGYVYRGSAIPGLNGTYIYSDYGPGPVWGLANPTGQTPVNSSLLTSTSYISSFAEDNAGELYVVSFGDGQIFRIDPATTTVADGFPALLSETGCIDSLNPLQMASGLIPYEINAPFWSDGIIKDRWMALPDTDGINIEIDGDWTFPVNSILVKNFTLNDVRVETRLLVRHADGNWGGYSYEWNDTQTDATLVLNGKTTTKQSQTYIYPSSTECMVCHTPVAGYTLGPETIQLNRDKTYSSTGITAGQLATLDHIGLFTSNLTDIASLPALDDPTDQSASINNRARAYLHTNCSQCHRQGGPTDVNLDFHIDTALSAMNVCNVSPTHQIGTASAILLPGDAANSSMYLRMNCRDGSAGCATGDQMPPLGSAYVDTAGVNLLSSWINGLSNCL